MPVFIQRHSAAFLAAAALFTVVLSSTAEAHSSSAHSHYRTIVAPGVSVYPHKLKRIIHRRPVLHFHKPKRHKVRIYRHHNHKTQQTAKIIQRQFKEHGHERPRH